jgi:hypothetical protein
MNNGCVYSSEQWRVGVFFFKRALLKFLDLPLDLIATIPAGARDELPEEVGGFPVKFLRLVVSDFLVTWQSTLLMV